MKMLLVAIIALPCNSAVSVDDVASTTVVHACSNTVRYVWHERAETPMEVARQKHWRSLPRDDKPPIVAAKEVAPKKEAKKPAKKRKSKKRKRSK
jgi:hypothetical protein